MRKGEKVQRVQLLPRAAYRIGEVLTGSRKDPVPRGKV
jgi:hypothetical protein